MNHLSSYHKFISAKCSYQFLEIQGEVAIIQPNVFTLGMIGLFVLGVLLFQYDFKLIHRLLLGQST